jgi:hypothetical protein
VSFHSVLYTNRSDRIARGQAKQPDTFPDLGLDQVVSAIVRGKDEYDLAEFFYAPLHDAEAVMYRQAAMQDIERPGLLAKLNGFAHRLHEIRAKLAQLEKRYNASQRARWFLDTVVYYCDTISRVDRDLQTADLQSEAFVHIRDHVNDYATSDQFAKLVDDSKDLISALAAIRYNIRIQGLRVTIVEHQDEPDYGDEVENTFAKFNTGPSKAYRFEHDLSVDVDPVESKILERVATLYDSTFAKLELFYNANQSFVDPQIAVFDREVQFYISYLSYIAPLRKAGLQFCYPRVSNSDKSLHAQSSFDLALATKLSRDHVLPVCNDFRLDGAERIIVVSGPNQGGKTTFARTFGQLHYLGALGCLVPAAAAQLYLPDRVFTHFERVERMSSLRGKLQDDLIRVHEILVAATPRSIIIINEIFASTTLNDAVFLSHKVADAIVTLDALCVWVTFIEEVSAWDEKTVSMVSTVDPDNPDHRTFKIVRQRANGLAYAMSIARKYRLTRDAITERIPA